LGGTVVLGRIAVSVGLADGVGVADWVADGDGVGVIDMVAVSDAVADAAIVGLAVLVETVRKRLSTSKILGDCHSSKDAKQIMTITATNRDNTSA